MTKCERCKLAYEEHPPELAKFFGIDRLRMPVTGFLLWDPTQGKDVPEVDECRRDDCPGYKPEASA
ncbi:hypothetical protein C7T35_15340 [Variovorax sp. WS11]|uniref:hypothetical protein n=1 Tax=Variovorax sp. WS11 TaxID=1105204 RepID=UPI000D2A3A9C|nr:hypothetical protein [Variovorax sp. WS11]NDZ12064.1 hypothetical protein [Variovorax sp. WS11]PSL83755.1 hypothetical protein C7T35_15340 [Variovorax sp. WS11]